MLLPAKGGVAPATQVHATVASAGATLHGGHATQRLALASATVPAGHGKQRERPRSPSVVQPGAQGTHPPPPSSAKVPAGQAAQTLLLPFADKKRE